MAQHPQEPRHGRYALHGDQYTLLMRQPVDNRRAGWAEIAVDTASLSSMWSRWMLAEPLPDIDFAEYVVVAWGEAFRTVQCSSLLALEMANDGTVWPVVHPATVPATGNLQRTQTLTSVVALPRRALVGSRLRFSADGQQDTFTTPWLDLGAAPKPHSTAPPTRRVAFGTLRGDVAVPPLGEVAAERLPDGLFVWVVHHLDGEISVLDSHETLDATGAAHFFTVEGLRMPVRYREDVRRFDGVGEYDEYGNSTGGTMRAALPRYRFERVEDRIRIGSGTEARAHSPAASQAMVCSVMGDVQTVPQVPPDEVLSLAEALRMPVGQSVTFDAVLVAHGTDPPVVCAPHPVDAACPSGEVQVMDAKRIVARQHPNWPYSTAMPRADRKLMITGPITARIAAGGLRDVRIAPFAGYLEHTITGVRQPSYPHRIFPGSDADYRSAARMYSHGRRLGLPVGGRYALWQETAVYGLLNLHDTKDVQGGISFREGLALHRKPDAFAWETQRSGVDAAWKVLVGDAAGLDLRAEYLFEGSMRPPTLRLGVQPRAWTNLAYDGRTASLLGLLLPELGWAWRRGDGPDDHDAYSTWHVPLSLWMFKQNIAFEIDLGATWYLADVVDSGAGVPELSLRVGVVAR